MIQLRLIGSPDEIATTLEQLKETYEVHHQSPRKGRKGEEWLCYVNALIPKPHRKISELEAEIEALKEEIQGLQAPDKAVILSPGNLDGQQQDSR